MKNTLFLIFLCSAVLALTTDQPLASEPATTASVIPPDQQVLLAAMKARGVDASFTILPIRLAGKPWDRISEVTGLMLEQKGMKNLEIGKSAPEYENAAALDQLASVVGVFVQTNPITTEYALFAEFNGTRQTGLNELRAVVVNKAGNLVWSVRLTPADPPMQQLESREPMTFCLLLVDQLSPQLGLNEETAKAAQPGKMAALMDKRSGLPPQAERDAIPARLTTLKQALPKASLTVYSPRISGKATTPANATNIVQLINNETLCAAIPAQDSLVMKASQSDPNELKALWGLAQEFRAYVRTHPPATDYALYADYAFNPENVDQGFVHFIICDHAGEWVIVDKQNSHDSDYQSLGLTSQSACDRLLLKRLETYLR